MEITVRGYRAADVPAMADIWNQVVAEGVAFPQKASLTETDAAEFFAQQSWCGVAEADSEVLGLYILHPNNVGRCGHICNASYAVDSKRRGAHIGEKLVLDCIAQGRALGFRILQFNAVVCTNLRARRLYERLGFRQLGVIPGGFRLNGNRYVDICPYYIELGDGANAV